VHRDIKPTECCIRYPASNPGHSANNIFPRSDLLAPLDQSSFGLAFGFPRVFTISFLRRSVPGFAEMLSNLGRH
jgi:hypothetical protein